MIRRCRVRKPAKSRNGQRDYTRTGAIYLQNLDFCGQTVIVMDRAHYKALRVKIGKQQKLLSRIRRLTISFQAS